ncbi:MAG: hypothetical protein KDK41_18100 [Leptospiraceae bacterium]|nr:hypothetical protein [Leptospiraceae bacterium]
MSISLLVIIILSLLGFFLSKEIFPMLNTLKSLGHPIRAVGKRLGHGIYSGTDKERVEKGLMSFFYLSLVIWVWVGWITFRTDYSFMLILFPFLMYYFGIRYFLWEKSDLHEGKKREEAKNV